MDASNRNRNETEINHPLISPSSLQSGFLAFDLEIAKALPGDFTQWRLHRPLGISCAALQFDGTEPDLWYSRKSEGQFAEKMSREDARKLVEYLVEAVGQGWKILTWNGLGFDFDVLAEESGDWEACQNLALNHMDMMFQFFCMQGFTLSLDKAARGMGLSGKMDGMTGELAPILWQQGQQRKVLEYVAQDVRTTLELAKAVMRVRRISWMSSSGRNQKALLPNGWVTVNQAMDFPLPDTSWMRKPMNRSEFFRWTTKDHPPLNPSESDNLSSSQGTNSKKD